MNMFISPYIDDFNAKVQTAIKSVENEILNFKSYMHQQDISKYITSFKQWLLVTNTLNKNFNQNPCKITFIDKLPKLLPFYSKLRILIISILKLCNLFLV